MGKEKNFIHRHVSTINRYSQIYFDRELAPYHIGSGQQFFLIRIAQNPGISVLELAKKGYYDKGTTARAVQKLEEIGYVERKDDTCDKRSFHLFVSKEGMKVVKVIEEMLINWNQILVSGFDDVEAAYVEKCMEKVADNAYVYIHERKKEDICKNQS